MKKLIFITNPSRKLSGEIRVASDKSISHRALMLGSIAQGITNIENLLNGADVIATMNAFKKMGVVMSSLEQGRLTINGVGLHGLKAPNNALDMGNSGTAMRLLAGLLAGQKFNSTLIGDESLSKRPMLRVVEPLSKMGANITTTLDGTSPLVIKGSQQLQGIEYQLPIASAQIKSAILLAGLYAQGETTIIETEPSRNHTECMLQSFGCKLIKQNNIIKLRSGVELITPNVLNIPADISSAAFFMVAATIAQDADITLLEVGINPTRTGIIDILRLMGANIELFNVRSFGGEQIADIRVQSSELNGIEIPTELIPLAIDEFPVIFVAASYAQGNTTLRNAKELRVKESDRIAVMAQGLQSIGVTVNQLDDGIIINGGKRITGGKVHAYGDHRIAMAFSVAGIIAQNQIIIDDCTNVVTSFPNFVELANKTGMQISEHYD